MTNESWRGGDVRDVILRDGSTLRLEQPGSDSRDDLLRFFRTSSPEALHSRFREMVKVDARFAERFVGDGVNRISLIGRLEGEIVALATLDRLRDATAAEVSFLVADRLQERGVGTRLLEQLAEIARAAGIVTFVAEVAAANVVMLAVFRDAGFEVTRERVGDTVELQFAVGLTDAYVTRVDARDHVAAAASLRAFFAPRSIAVIGASPRPGTVGNAVVGNLLASGFDGPIYPVNRSGRPVHGITPLTDAADIPGDVDLAVICVPAGDVVDVADRVTARGLRAVCVLSAGFAETGPRGAELQDQLLAVVRARGGRMLGPNCLGIAVPGSAMNATFARHRVPVGRVAFSSQSGALGLAVLEYSTSRGFGLASFVSVGNKADISTNDLLEYWEDDEDARLVMLYVESFGNPRKFARIAARVARRKPIVAMRGGASRSGARAAGSHTAAIAGSDAAATALFSACGVLRASTLEELVDSAAFLAGQPVPKGNRVAVVTNAGGLGILCADACEADGLELAAFSELTTERLERAVEAEASVANPVDILGSAAASTYGAVLPAVLEDDGVDAVIVLFAPAAASTADEVAESIRLACRGAAKPVAAVVMSGDGIPGALTADGAPAGFLYPESAARAVALATRRSAWLRRPVGVVRRPADIDEQAARGIVGEALEAGLAWLDPGRTRQLLGCYGLPACDQRIATSADEAVGAAEELGLPAVVKTARPGVHKTELGGVAIDLRDAAAVAAAFARIGGPVIVQPMISGGTELLCGLVQDPVFGAVVALAAGGILAELSGPPNVRVAPITDVDADELVSSGVPGAVLAGARGRDPGDAAAVADVLHRLSALGDDLPEVAELDLNPVLVLSRGCVAVDARVRVAAPASVRTPRTW